jgi:hypothetical protein
MSERARVEWRFYSGDNAATKYSPLDQINKSNVATLPIAWRRPQVDAGLTAGVENVRLQNNFRSTPMMVNGVLYASNGVGLAKAFDPETGMTLRVQKADADGLRGSANRGRDSAGASNPRTRITNARYDAERAIRAGGRMGRAREAPLFDPTGAGESDRRRFMASKRTSPCSRRLRQFTRALT